MVKDLDYLRITYEHAEANSPDLSTRIGAILVRNGEVIVREANRFPEGVIVKPERLTKRPEKYEYIEHAETNAIYTAISNGITDFSDIKMYCNFMICGKCARTVIRLAKGIELIGHQIPLEWGANLARETGKNDWQKSINAAWEMLDEAGIKYRYVYGKIGVKNLYAGRIMIA